VLIQIGNASPDPAGPAGRSGARLRGLTGRGPVSLDTYDAAAFADCPVLLVDRYSSPLPGH
jgi:hypothetical protein